MLPASGRTRPSITRISVDLPAPFAPSRPIARSVIDTLTSRSASTAPKLFVTPAASTIGSVTGREDSAGAVCGRASV